MANGSAFFPPIIPQDEFNPTSIKDIRSIPIDKHQAVSGNIFNLINVFNPFADNPTRFKSPQSGVVQIKVLINRFCPFRKASAEYSNMLLNLDTIENNFPASFKEKVDGHSGVDGLSPNRRYIYRHNFLFFPGVSPALPGPEIISNSSVVAGEPEYKPHTSFRILPSVFQTTQDFVTSNECNSLPDFVYSSQESASEVDFNDMANDGFPDAYPSVVQTIHQQKTQTCAKEGIHWRIDKEVANFQAQDFFITFFEHSGQRDLRASKANDSRKFTDPDYDYLDANVNATTRRLLDRPIPINQAVASYQAEITDDNVVTFEKDEQFNKYNFNDQAYLVIELGKNSEVTSHIHSDIRQHYFIIITDRGFPRFVSERDRISFLLSEYDGAGGRFLFDSKAFRMTVQNWLGKIVITFDVPGRSLPPWIIDRFDHEIENETGQIKRSKAVTMFIPVGFMSIWGGNIPISFNYGPLQYSSETNFLLPPKENINVPESFKQIQFKTFKANKLRMTFSQTDFPVLKGAPFLPLYSCDAQEFREYIEEGHPFAVNRPNMNLDGTELTVQGNFFGFPSYRAKSGVDIIEQEVNRSKITLDKVNVDDSANRTDKFDIAVKMKSGHHSYRVVGGDPDSEGWKLFNCIPPIITNIRLIGDIEDPPKRWKTEGAIDVTDHVMMYQDSWSAQDFNRIDHTGNITFLLNRGATYENDQTEFLKSATNRTFYIEVWAGYKGCNYSQLSGFCKLFTGLCQGGTIEVSAGRLVMNCQINDYRTVLEGQLIFNSPFFDGFDDVAAIHQLLEMAGLRSEGSGLVEERPGEVLRILEERRSDELIFGRYNDGRTAWVCPYALPSSYDKLQDPKFKFQDASTFAEAIDQITKRAAKLFYFDSLGLAHYESYLDMVINALGFNPTSPTNNQIPPFFWFTSNPTIFKGQQIFNKYSIYLNVADVRNHIKIFSNTPDFQIQISDQLNWDSFDNPESEGFLGYLRSFYQADGAFGSERATKVISLFYTAMMRPPIVVKFETYGQPVRALDIIALNEFPYRVMKVDTTIDPSRNLWWQNFECEWLQKIKPVVIGD